MARIVATDNFGMSGDGPGKDERFLLWPMDGDDARIIAETLNKRVRDTDYWIYKVVDDKYRLQVFKP